MRKIEKVAPDSLNVSRETFERLCTYVDLVERWNPKINLVSPNSLRVIWTRHVKDSVQVFQCSEPTAHWVDLGSGGGFPGMVCAIMAIGVAPDMRFTLIESDQRKSVFLRNVARELRIAIRALASLVGRIDVETLLDEIFASFCLGK